MSYRFAHGLFAATLLMCGAALYAHTYDAQYLDMGGATNSLFYPRLLFAVWMGTSILMLRETWRLPEGTARPYAWRQTLAGVGCIALFLVLFVWLGFVISSIVFFTLFALFLGARAPLKVLALATVYSLFIDYVFTSLLHISLPALGG